MHCTNDAEKIDDHAEIMYNLIKRLNSSDKKLSKGATLELKQVWRLLCFQGQHILLYLESPINESAEAALKKGRKLTNFSQQFENNHIKRLKKGNVK